MSTNEAHYKRQNLDHVDQNDLHSEPLQSLDFYLHQLILGNLVLGDVTMENRSNRWRYIGIFQSVLTYSLVTDVVFSKHK